MDVLVLTLALLALAGVFATTRPGRAFLKRTGFRDKVPGAAPQEDVAYLLTLCEGDREEASRRVAVERERVPALTEAEHYRRAIRRSLQARAAGRSG